MAKLSFFMSLNLIWDESNLEVSGQNLKKVDD